MFTAQCRGEAFAKIGIHAFILKLANALPLLFQKTKLLPNSNIPNLVSNFDHLI